MVGTDVCRVSVHGGGGQADIALPADTPVGQLIPSLYDVLVASGGPWAANVRHRPPTCVRQPGQPPLDPAMSLSENGIRDGSVLVLASVAPDPAPVRVVHAADAVEHVAHAQLHSPAPERPRLTALLVVIAMAAVAGFVAVPDGIAAPRLLLSASAAAGAGAVCARASRYGRTALLAITCLCTFVATAAMVATIFGIPGPSAGLGLAVVSIGVLTIPGRLPVMMSGLSGHIEGELDPDSRAVDGDIWVGAARAQDLLTALVAGASLAAALGIVAVTLATSQRGWPDFAVAGLVAAALILRSRSHAEPIRRALLLGCGTACAAALFVGLRLHEPGLGPWICVPAAGFAAGAIWLGFDPSAATGSAVVRRCLDLLDCVTLLCVIPVACWSAGVFGAVRGIDL